MDATLAKFHSNIPIDKIVRIFAGSFDPVTSTVNRPYTLAGSPYNLPVFRIPHGLTRPVMCDLQWSYDDPLDIGVFYDNGMVDFASRSCIAFSDSTYVYMTLPSNPSTYTVRHRIYCSWINDYDTTNPSVDTRLYTDTPAQFDSRNNTQKVYLQDVVSFSAGTAGAQQTIPIAHNLGYTPNVKVFFEAFSGEVWPVNAGGASNVFLFDDTQDECQLSIDSTKIDITLTKFSNQVKRAWYRIYYDAN